MKHKLLGVLLLAISLFALAGWACGGSGRPDLGDFAGDNGGNGGDNGGENGGDNGGENGGDNGGDFTFSGVAGTWDHQYGSESMTLGCTQSDQEPLNRPDTWTLTPVDTGVQSLSGANMPGIDLPGQIFTAEDNLERNGGAGLIPPSEFGEPSDEIPGGGDNGTTCPYDDQFDSLFMDFLPNPTQTDRSFFFGNVGNEAESHNFFGIPTGADQLSGLSFYTEDTEADCPCFFVREWTSNKISEVD